MALNLNGIADMRSGGSVLEAPGPFIYWGAEEGALPREHRPQAVATNCLRVQKRLSGISESLFLYVLELAKLNLTA